jgi:hypothetical protein
MEIFIVVYLIIGAMKAHGLYYGRSGANRAMASFNSSESHKVLLFLLVMIIWPITIIR